MTVNVPKDVLDLVRAEVRSGRFANEEEMIAAAIRDYLCRRGRDVPHENTSGQCAHGSGVDAPQRRLYEAGVLSEVKPPVADLSPYRGRQPASVQGELLSQTVIRERR
jgi:Arc/MetJ-type ribon-helix-helix transcriptional regulator